MSDRVPAPIAQNVLCGFIKYAGGAATDNGPLDTATYCCQTGARCGVHNVVFVSVVRVIRRVLNESARSNRDDQVSIVPSDRPLGHRGWPEGADSVATRQILNEYVPPHSRVAIGG